MANATSSIEWTDATWSPTIGCTRVSAGCDSCYAFALHDRRHAAYLAGTFPDAPAQYHKPFSEVQLLPDRLTVPLRWRAPKRIFVDSMSDLFHADVPTEFIDRVWAVMMLAPVHTFQILTKRPQRMFRYVSDPALYDRVLRAAQGFRCWRPALWDVPLSNPTIHPARNIWLGTSVENQEAAYRIDWLVKTPAAVRFLSCEPLLGPLDLSRWLWYRLPPIMAVDPRGVTTGEIDWIIAGGESGAGARPMHPDWARALRDQCTAAGVPYFFKQWGGIRSKAGGRLLDGIEWSQFPEVSA